MKRGSAIVGQNAEALLGDPLCERALRESAAPYLVDGVDLRGGGQLFRLRRIFAMYALAAALPFTSRAGLRELLDAERLREEARFVPVEPALFRRFRRGPELPRVVRQTF